MKKRFLLTALATLLSSALAFASDVPIKGESQQGVEHRFGSPIEKKAAVGKPAIIRWLYSGFTVYFENNRVIHSVKN